MTAAVRIGRRAAAAVAATLLVVGILWALSPQSPPARRRVMVLGIDGMDYALTQEFMAEGRLPNFSRLAAEGSFLPLQTAMPPLSPVAWTNVITGANAGGHGVFDFLRLNRRQVGDGVLPENGISELTSGGPVLRRSGRPFWEILEAAGIPATIYKMPANFPVPAGRARVLSGMCTPDIEGGYGTYTYISDSRDDWGKQVTGGRIHKASVVGGVVRLINSTGQNVAPYLTGPTDPLASGDIPLQRRQGRAEFSIYVDRDERTAVIALQGREILLTEGQWSDWLTIEFEPIGQVRSVNGIVRFYLKQAAPEFRLLASPVNLAPGSWGLASGDLDMQLAEAVGPFYTKGMAEQTKAHTGGILNVQEYLAQSDLVLAERQAALEALLSGFGDGLLFFYVSTLDLDCHVLWRHRDPSHPAYDKRISPAYADAIASRYEKMDQLLGRARGRLGPADVLYVMSDHGFTSFHTEVNLMTWLAEEGYLLYKSYVGKRSSKMYAEVDWSRTRAYPTGFNGLSVNLRGREASGIVDPADKQQLLDEIRGRLLALRDPKGVQVFHNIYHAREVYAGPRIAEAADLLLGYARGFGPSDDSVLGTWSQEVFAPKLDGFSGHHGVDYKLVPGVLFSNRRLRGSRARLEDIPVSVLRDFGIGPAAGMTGRALE